MKPKSRASVGFRRSQCWAMRASKAVRDSFSMTMQRAKRPWLVAFWEERRFPSGVTGPRERAPLVRAARVNLIEDIVLYTFPFISLWLRASSVVKSKSFHRRDEKTKRKTKYGQEIRERRDSRERRELDELIFSASLRLGGESLSTAYGYGPHFFLNMRIISASYELVNHSSSWPARLGYAVPTAQQARATAKTRSSWAPSRQAPNCSLPAVETLTCMAMSSVSNVGPSRKSAAMRRPTRCRR